MCDGYTSPRLGDEAGSKALREEGVWLTLREMLGRPRHTS